MDWLVAARMPLILKRARDQYESTGEKQRLFGTVIYGAKSRKLKHSVIVKAKHSDKGANPRSIVTSLQGDDEHIYDNIYCARGEMVPRNVNDDRSIAAGTQKSDQ